MPPPKTDPPLPHASPHTAHTWLSLLLIVHLFFVFVATTGNYAPSALQARLLDRFAGYTRVLNLDRNFTPRELSADVVRLTTAPEHLTHAAENDVDHRIEFLTAGEVGGSSDAWSLFGSGGFRGGERHKRFQRLARYLAEVANNESAAARIAQGVAEAVAAQQGTLPPQVRGRKHMLQPMDAWSSSDPQERDPDSAVYFRTTYAVNVVSLGDTIQVVKIESSGQAAGPATAKE